MSKIIGNTTATPNPRPDWNQTDATKADFIKNKPNIFNAISVDNVDLIPSTNANTLEIDSGRHIKLIPNTGTKKITVNVEDVVKRFPRKDDADEVSLALGDNFNETIKLDVIFQSYNSSTRESATVERITMEVELRSDQSAGHYEEYSVKDVVIRSNFDIKAWFNYATNVLAIGGFTGIKRDLMFVEIDSSYESIVSFTDIVTNDTAAQSGYRQVAVERIVNEEYLGEIIEAESQKVNESIEALSKNVSEDFNSLDRRVTNIENFINPKYYITAEERAFERVIPANACPYIELNSVGGVYSRASNNLLNPELFGTDVDDRGYIYYPGSRHMYYAEITLNPGTYTVHSDVQFCLEGHSVDAEYFITKFTFTLTEEKKVRIYLDGDMPGWDEPFWFWIMLNKGQTALPFESYYKYAPVKHCDNLIPFPYYMDSQTIEGITFTVNDDGTIILNGTIPSTADVNAIFNITVNDGFSLDAGTYTLSGTGNSNVVVRFSGGIAYDASTKSETFTTDKISKSTIFLYVKKGTTLTNFVVKPMLNKGETALPHEPYYEGTKSTKITAIEHYGANLVDDEAIFTSFGFQKQDNGYWLGTQKIKPIFENKEGKSGAISISYQGKLITTTSDSNSPLAFYAEYTDGTGAWLWQLAFTKNNTDYAIKTATTDATKIVKEIKYGYGVNGTYEIKDLIINWGGVVDYKPYSAEPLFTYEIPEAIQKLEGYGMGLIDFENKKFIQYDGFLGDNPSDRVEHDISAALADFDNIFEVQAGGTLRFVNEAKAAIPSSFTYLAKEDSV